MENKKNVKDPSFDEMMDMFLSIFGEACEKVEKEEVSETPKSSYVDDYKVKYPDTSKMETVKEEDLFAPTNYYFDNGVEFNKATGSFDIYLCDETHSPTTYRVGSIQKDSYDKNLKRRLGATPKQLVSVLRGMISNNQKALDLLEELNTVL